MKSDASSGCAGSSWGSDISSGSLAPEEAIEMISGEAPVPVSGMELPLERNSRVPRIVNRGDWLRQLRSRHPEAGISAE